MKKRTQVKRDRERQSHLSWRVRSSRSTALPSHSCIIGELTLSVSPAFVTGVVGRVNVDALHLAGVGGQQRLQRLEVVGVDDEIVVQPHLVREAPVPLGHQSIILDGEMMILDERFAFEIECGQRVPVVARATATTGILKKKRREIRPRGILAGDREPRQRHERILTPSRQGAKFLTRIAQITAN